MNVITPEGKVGWFHGKTGEWTSRLGSKTAYGYRSISIGNKNRTVSRLVAEAHLPDWDKSLDVDHINGKKDDNRVINLRMATRTRNLQGHRNIAKNSTSAYRGVSWNKQKGKWIAYITVNKSRKHLGYFKDELEASKAFNRASIKYDFPSESLNK